jgi:beta-fructofuranosidase
VPDANFPALHIRPAHGWLNDPNGVCRIDGRYHVFFQFNPESPQHAMIHWGHWSSDDLLHWTEEPIALRPQPGTISASGCWSGCVVDDAGVPTAVYSANPDHAWNAQAALAYSDRTLREWRQETRGVMAGPDDPAIAEVRDPFIFTFEGHRYALQGAGHQSGNPQILVYACDDLHDWTPLGAFLTVEDTLAAEIAPANIWECPNLVQIDGRWVLLVSLWQFSHTYVLAGVRYLVGEVTATPDGPRFRCVSGGPVDTGPAFYAPQVMSDGGRVLLWGWSWELGRTPEQVAAAGWQGVLTFPRELSLDPDGVLIVRPAAELSGLRCGERDWRSGEAFRAAAFEVVSDGPWSLTLTARPEPVAQGAGPARVLVDGSQVEVYTETASFTTRAYPDPDGSWVVTAGPNTLVYDLGL